MRDNAEKTGKGPEVEERTLFHGTSRFETVRGICINNFDHRLCGENGTRHGKGAYFATTARYSDHFTSPPDRYLFLARVLVGEYTKSDHSYTRPPSKPGSAHDLYDSCVDNVDNPSIFVVFDTKQYYPEFLIQYHSAKDPPIPVLERTKAIPSPTPIFTSRGSYKQTDSSDFIGTVDRKNISNPPATQIIPPSAKGLEKMPGRQARQSARSSVSNNLAASNNHSEGCSQSSRTADLISLYEHRTADRDCSGTTNSTLSKSEMSQSAAGSADNIYAGRHRIKIYGLELDSSSLDEHEKLTHHLAFTKEKPAEKSESNLKYLAKTGSRSDEQHSSTKTDKYSYDRTAEEQLRLFDNATSGPGRGEPIQEAKVAIRSRHTDKDRGLSFIRNTSSERYNNDF